MATYVVKCRSNISSQRLLVFSGPEANQDGDRLFLGRQPGSEDIFSIEILSHFFPIDAGIGMNMPWIWHESTVLDK